MRADLHIPRGLHLYEAALEGLAGVNEILYREDPSLPSVYDAARYVRERAEAWRNAREVIGDGWGDCEDLAAARVGELRAAGESDARVIVRRTGPKMTHALVMRADGTIEDPSAELGMYDQEPYSSDDEEMIGADVSGNPELSWTVDRTPTGWKGTVRVPLDAGRALFVTRSVPRTAMVPARTARGPSKPGGKKGALDAALSAASKVLDNPTVAALIPGEARFALNLVRSSKARKLASKILSIF